MAAPFALRYYIGPDIQRIAPQTPNLTADQVVGNQYGGFFRLQNCASGRLLTSVKSITGDGYSLQGYNLRVPDPNDPISQNQVWKVSRNTSNSDPNAVAQWTLESATLSDTKGQPYRVDFPDTTEPGVDVSGRSNVPNNLSPPGELVFASVPPPPAVDLPNPIMSSYTRDVTVDSKASSQSAFQIVKTSQPGIFLIYNQATGTFLGHEPAQTGLYTTISSPDCYPEGQPVRAADLKTLATDVHTQIVSYGDSADMESSIWYIFSTSWAWKFVSADSGPVNTPPFRLLNSLSSLALDSASVISSSVHPKAIDPSNSTQLWNATTEVDIANGRIVHTITNYAVKSTALTSQTQPSRWRLVRVPPKGATVPTDNFPDYPEGTSDAPFQFLLLSESGTACKTITSSSVGDQVTPTTLDNPLREFNILNTLFDHSATFWSTYASAVWTYLPQSSLLPDGLYSIASKGTSNSLQLKPYSPSEPAPLYLQAPVPADPTRSTSWWNITSSIATSGTIYQTISNYRTGQALVVQKAQSTISSTAAPTPVASSTTVSKWRVRSIGVGFDVDISDYDDIAYGLGVVNNPNSPQYVGLTQVPKFTLSLISLIPPGSYYIMNAYSGNFIYIGPNAAQVEMRPWSSSYLWNVTSNGNNLTITATANSPAVSISSGANVSYQTDSTESSPFIPKVDPQTGLIYLLLASDTTKVLDYTNTAPVVTPQYATLRAFSTTSLTQRWRFYSATDIAALYTAGATWQKPLVGSLPNLPDGVYRISNKGFPVSLAVAAGVQQQSNSGVLIPAPTPVVVGALSTEPSESLWYIRRDRNPHLQPVDQLYTLQNLSVPIFLEESVSSAGQPAPGVRLIGGLAQGFSISAQKWRLWGVSQGAWVFQSAESQGILDISGSNAVTIPPISSGQTPTQTWSIDSPLPIISSGYYKILNLKTNTFLCSSTDVLTPQSTASVASTNGVLASAFGKFGISASQWKVTVRIDGSYQLQKLGSQAVLTVTASGAAVTSPAGASPSKYSSWNIRGGSGTGFTIENIATRTVLTSIMSITDPVPQGLATRSIANLGWQSYSFQRIDNPSPVYDELPSVKLQPGVYSIFSSKTGKGIAFQSVSSLGVALTTATTAKNWNIVPSGTGYYAIGTADQADVWLGSFDRVNVPCSAIPELNQGLWKLLKTATDTYKLVNVGNGLLLTITGQGIPGWEVGDSVNPGSNEFTLAFVSAIASPPTIYGEVAIASGLYTIETVSGGVTGGVSLPSAAIQGRGPNIGVKNANEYSWDKNQDIWQVKQNLDGWYTLSQSAISYRLAIDTSSNKATGEAPALGVLPNSQWKFLRTSTSQLRLINRSNPLLNLAYISGTPILQGYNYRSYLKNPSSSDYGLWNINLVISSTISKLSPGTYTITQYQPSAYFTLHALTTITTSTAPTALQTLQSFVTYVQGNKQYASTTPIPPYVFTSVDVTALSNTLASIDATFGPVIAQITGSLFEWKTAYNNNRIAMHLTSGGALGTSIMQTAAVAVGNGLISLCQQAVLKAYVNLENAYMSFRIAVNSPYGYFPVTPSNLQLVGTLLLKTVLTYPNASVPWNTHQPAVTTLFMGEIDTGTTSGFQIYNAAVQPQNLDNLFYFKDAGKGNFTINRLGLISGLGRDSSNNLLITTTPIAWTIQPQSIGGYTICPADNTNLALSFTNGKFAISPIEVGSLWQLWDISQSGYLLQNQASERLALTPSFTTDAGGLGPFRMISYNPYYYGIKTNSGARSGAVWHLVRNYDPSTNTSTYGLVNEATQTLLQHNHGISGTIDGLDNVSPGLDMVWRSNNQWVLANAPTDEPSSIFPGYRIAVKDTTGIGAKNRLALSVGDPGLVLTDKNDTKNEPGWSFVGVSAYQRGDFLNLPRVILQSKTDVSKVWGFNIDTYTPAQVTYNPDDASQRWRVLVYGTRILYINEATYNTLGQALGVGNIQSADPGQWSTQDAPGSLNSNGLLFSTVNNTGDFPSGPPATYRIQLLNWGLGGALPKVLSVNSGTSVTTVIVDDWDKTSVAQKWTFIDWSGGRYIINIQSNQMLTAAGAAPTAVTNNYALNALWNVDTGNVKAGGNNGIFPVRSLSSPSSALGLPLNPPVGPSNLTTFSNIGTGVLGLGARFIRDSSAISITPSNTVSQLKLFLQNYSPVFVHSTGAPVPVNADDYIQSSTLNIHGNTTFVSTYTPGTYTSTNNFLSYTAPASPPTPKVYVAVRDAFEGIYDNYTDVFYYVLYPNAGWKSVTLRFNNETKRLESAYMPNVKWMYNLDLSFSNRFDSNNNPLRILKTASGLTKLHIYVDSNLNFLPAFPSGTTDATVINQLAWGLSLDAGSDVNIIEAETIKDDAAGSKPRRPFWADFNGDWISGYNKSPWLAPAMLM